jgi:hypothetical protein
MDALNEHAERTFAGGVSPQFVPKSKSKAA